MGVASIAACLLLVSCGCANLAGTEDRFTTPAGSASHEPTQTYYSEADLRALGLRTVPLDAQRTLLCGGDSDCVCLEPLPCDRDDDCITLMRNVQIFRDALANGQGDRKVRCSRGEIGRCNGFSYFSFDGDIDRHEMRWFGGSGRLVGQREWTDYAAYCDGRARVRFMGRVPKCTAMARDDVICGKAPDALPSAIEDLLSRSGKRLGHGESVRSD